MTILTRNIFSPDHEAFRDSARRFFEQEVAQKSIATPLSSQSP